MNGSVVDVPSYCMVAQIAICPGVEYAAFSLPQNL